MLNTSGKNYTQEDRLKAAYALNLCTVSVSQIVDYNDLNIMEQEYQNILNNLNLEEIPKDEALLDVLKRILDTITYFRIAEGDRKLLDLEYQHKMKNAIWTAIPNMGMIFASGNPIALGLTLATQVGIGYMNYRRNRADYQLNKQKEEWQLTRSALDQLNGLRRSLFETAWRLADEYDFPDEYRLSDQQIHEYNEILMETNPIKRFNLLNASKSNFIAYPAFWYQLGSAANSIFRSTNSALTPELRNLYKTCAIDSFTQYSKLNQFNLLRRDTMTSAWALEYVDLLDLTNFENLGTAKQLIASAEKHSGNENDILELCAYAYLKVNDPENAARIFNILVNKNYNSEINTKVLSGLYINQMLNEGSCTSARMNYDMLALIAEPNYLLPIPASREQWLPSWTSDSSPTAEKTEPNFVLFEDLTISSPVHIKKGESISYQSKYINIDADIHCEGTICFEACTIHYNGSSKGGQILLSETSSASFKNCKFICHSYNDRFFISYSCCENELIFNNCEFSDCNYFLRVSNGSISCKTDRKTIFDHCKATNPGLLFIEGNSLIISNSQFLFDGKTPFFLDKDKYPKFNSFDDYIIGCLSLEMTNTTIKRAPNISDFFIDSHIRFISVGQINISDCKFSYITDAIITRSLADCCMSNLLFEYCSSAIYLGNMYSLELNDTTFDHCKDILFATSRCTISHCHFNNCVNQLIESDFNGHAIIKHCDFNNWCTINDNEEYEPKGFPAFFKSKEPLWGNNMLLLKTSKGKDCGSNYVEHCSFSNNLVEKYYLIACHTTDKIKDPVAIIRDCNFYNCMALNEDGKLIQEYDSYYPAFGRPQTLKTASIYNCKGL